MEPVNHRLKKNAQSPETAFARGKTAQWLSRVMEAGVALDSPFFDCLDWSLGGLRDLLNAITQEARKLPRNARVAKARHALAQAAQTPARRLGDELETLAEQHPCLQAVIAGAIHIACAQARKSAVNGRHLFIQAARRIRHTFGLDADSLRVCEFAFINDSFSRAQSYFLQHLELHKFGNARLMADTLGVSRSTLQTSVDKLVACGLLDDAEIFFSLSSGVSSYWKNSDALDAKRLFCRRLAGETLPLEDFCIAPEAVAHVRALLESESEEPLHILLYGAPGTGKTTFARSLARACGVKAWSVVSRDNDNDANRRASLSACLHMASGHKGAFVLADEAERLLDTEMSFGGQTRDKAWLNDFLEQPGRRVIWITNEIEHIDQAVRRRFTYSIQFDELDRLEAARLWRRAAGKHRVQGRLTEKRIAMFAKKHRASAAVISGAIAQAKRICPGKAGFEDAVERILSAYSTLRRGGRKPNVMDAVKARAVADFSPDGTCMEGSAPELLARCRRVDAAMRAAEPLRPGLATMLFYGPPGTGKTALARYIAETLGRKCLVKRASDLLSPYVGVTEERIAGAFEEAEKDDAVLVVDEADSFLYSRDIAHCSWEASMVNEFLTALEECRTFCICTTNRREILDDAAMRRFSHKIAFGYAKPAQVRALYTSLLAPLCQGPLPAELEKEMLGCATLTPGDFHAVRSQYDNFFADEQVVDHKTLVAALRKEQKLKTEKRRIGFGSREA